MHEKKLNLAVLSERLGICIIKSTKSLPDWADTSSFLSVTGDKDRLFLVCAEELIPDVYQYEKGWKCLKVKDTIDFSERGIIYSVSRHLAQAGVASFVLSTYDTEYLLLRENDLSRAVKALTKEGHKVFWETDAN